MTSADLALDLACQPAPSQLLAVEVTLFACCGHAGALLYSLQRRRSFIVVPVTVDGVLTVSLLKVCLRDD